MKRLSYILKSSRLIYTVYYYVMSTVIRFMGLFMKTDGHTILFNSFGGKKFDDSPKAIYDAMRVDERFRDYRLLWAFQEPKKLEIPDYVEVIRADTVQYFVTCMRAGAWITNSSMERGLSFKKKNTLRLNTWHGTAIKLMGIDIPDRNQSFRKKKTTEKVNWEKDIMLAQGQYDVDVFSHAFERPVSSFCITGLPRNDILANYTEEDAVYIRKKLGLPGYKKIFLYAPTFREYTKGSRHEVVQDIPMDLQYWQEELGDECVILFRAHYEVAKRMDIGGYPLFTDVSSYQPLDDLMIAADGLISDYSSIYFDFSIMHKPMYCFAYDYDEYMVNRGMYINLKEELPCRIHTDEKSLIDDLKRFDDIEAEYSAAARAFQEKYITKFGTAARESCDIIYKELRC